MPSHPLAEACFELLLLQTQFNFARCRRQALQPSLAARKVRKFCDSWAAEPCPTATSACCAFLKLRHACACRDAARGTQKLHIQIQQCEHQQQRHGNAERTHPCGKREGMVDQQCCAAVQGNQILAQHFYRTLAGYVCRCRGDDLLFILRCRGDGQRAEIDYLLTKLARRWVKPREL